MPMYEYECPECYQRITEIKSLKDIDDAPECENCKGVQTKRVLSAGIFKINGFSEANGYSKCEGTKG